MYPGGSLDELTRIAPEAYSPPKKADRDENQRDEYPLGRGPSSWPKEGYEREVWLDSVVLCVDCHYVCGGQSSCQR
jgi:hypothetical protein